MNKRIWLMVVLAVWLVVMACGVSDDLSGVRDTGKAFMTALKDGDHAASYAMLSPGVQQEIGDMNAWVDFATPRNFEEYSFSSTNIENGVGKLDGEATLQGDKYNINLVIEKFGEDWKITGLNFQLK